MAPGPSLAARRSRIDLPLLMPIAVALVGVSIVGLAGIRGADYPAHLLRAELWRETGVSVWNFHWYGGHSTPTYSVIVPPLTALFGAFTVTAVASVLATWWFSAVVLSHTRQPWAVAGLVAFALSATVNVIVGRVPFSVGLAFAMLALYAWHRQRAVVAVGAAALVPLASPVAAVFLAIAGAAWLIDALLDRRWGRADAIAAAVAGAALLPLGVLAVSFGSEGRFPFRGDQAAFSIALIALLAMLARHRAIRVGAIIAAVASIVVFLVPNPLGGNFLRLTQFVVVPLVIVALGAARRPRPWVFTCLFLVTVGWSVQFGALSAIAWQGDESVHAEYHEPLVDEVGRRNADGNPVGRLEIPFTDNHWEAYFVASEVPFARGWERQLDLERNAVLYDPDLTVEQYRAWLHENAVRWIAIPDVDLDEGGNPEAALIRSGAVDPWLEPVWSNVDWVLYEVVGYQPIVDPPAMLVAERPDAIVLTTPGPATVTVRYTATEGAGISPAGCVAVDDEWMRLTLPAAGTYTIASTRRRSSRATTPRRAPRRPADAVSAAAAARGRGGPRSRGAPAPRSSSARGPRGSRRRTRGPAARCRSSTRDTRHVDRLVVAVEQVVVAGDVGAAVADVSEERAERTVVVERQRQRAGSRPCRS
jgi:hypothetical protein